MEELLQAAGLLEPTALFTTFKTSLCPSRNQCFARASIVPKRPRLYRARRRQCRQVIIIDEFTGRMMEGRRFSDGLHQALEAKEAPHPAGKPDARLRDISKLFPPLQAVGHDRHNAAEEFMDI